jgi:hypothetical protein
MIRAACLAAWFGRLVPSEARRYLWLVVLFALISIPLGAVGGDDFGPLFAGSSLEHSMRDKGYWSIQDGDLIAKTDSHRTENEFLFRQVRFGIFVLKFQARSDGATVNVLLRATNLPLAQLVGFATTIGGEQWGSLAFRKPVAQLSMATTGEPGHAGTHRHVKRRFDL